MELSAAISLLQKGADTKVPRQVWADLGSGNGLFTRALSEILGNESTIYAVDKDAEALKEISQTYFPGTIITQVCDFVADELNIGVLDGILMANSLHFVNDKASFLKRMHAMLNNTGRLLIVEYDITLGNPWISYPIGFASLKKLLMQTGFTHTEKLSEYPSRYQRSNMYSMVAW